MIDIKKRRGFVQLAILHLLEEGPKHGYQIMKELESRSSGFYTASAGTVYPALQELLDREMIELLLESDKKIYSLGTKGKDRLEEFSTPKENFWVNWQERWEWQNSQEAIGLKETLDLWEEELRKAVKASRKDKEQTTRLTNFIQAITKQLQQEKL